MEPKLLVVEDDAALAAALADSLELADYVVTTASDAEQALRLLAEIPFDLVVSDVNMPGMNGFELLSHIKGRRPELPVLLITAYGSIPRAVEAMRLGAADYLVKPFEAATLLDAVARHLAPPAADDEPVAEDPRSRELLALARRVAATDVTLFLTGESGTGKEVLARYLHRHSARAQKPFIAINCAAIPESMLEATLFGYEKGAFTGAVKATPGKFEQADGGTLLLDEVSEMALPLQAKLLRVLQEREVERLGGRETLRLDVRVIATSNRQLREEVVAGRFREDLFYRLNVFPLRIPALRERTADILPLAARLLARAAGRMGMAAPRISEAAAKLLTVYPFPGNVRELDNLMQRATILQLAGEVTPQSLQFEGELTIDSPSLLPASGAVPSEPPAEAADEGEELSRELRHREYELIRSALGQGSRKEAAERLGISPRTLRYKLQRMREEGWLVDEGGPKGA